MEHDLRQAAGAPVGAHIESLASRQTATLQALSGISIDRLDVTVRQYERTPGLLRCLPDAGVVGKTLVSDLLKSNCPVTGQPDWGSVQIRYPGHRIDSAALLRHIISLPRHQESHKHDVQHIYYNI